MSGQRATIQDVAHQSGVSVATVSRALRGKENVADETRARVIAVADRLGYQPHTAASWLASGKTMTVGVAAPYFDVWYTGRVLAGVEQVLSDAGYDLTVYAADTPDKRDRFAARSTSLQTRVDGLLLVDFSPDTGQLARLEASGIRIVAIGERLEPFASLAIDNISTAAEAVGHLVGLGHRRIALFGTEDIRTIGSPALTDRRTGYREALLGVGLAADPGLDIDCPLSVAGGAAGFDRFLRIPDRPTAIFCLSDETAMGAMGRARELGFSIPADVSIIGFDDHDLSESFGLTTMCQPVRQVGERAAELLLASIADPAAPCEHHTVGVELVVRRSTCPPATSAEA